MNTISPLSVWSICSLTCSSASFVLSATSSWAISSTKEIIRRFGHYAAMWPNPWLSKHLRAKVPVDELLRWVALISIGALSNLLRSIEFFGDIILDKFSFPVVTLNELVLDWCCCFSNLRANLTTCSIQNYCSWTTLALLGYMPPRKWAMKFFRFKYITLQHKLFKFNGIFFYSEIFLLNVLQLDANILAIMIQQIFTLHFFLHFGRSLDLCSRCCIRFEFFHLSDTFFFNLFSTNLTIHYGITFLNLRIHPTMCN